MKNIIINDNNLTDNEITEVVKRVKALIINSKNEILLGYSNHIYQFPGGHVENDESLIDTLKREVLEETGIILNIDNIEPFVCHIGYYKDWPEIGKNRKTEIYYYEIKTDKLPNFRKVKYTENEQKGNFELRYIKLDEFEKELNENAKKYNNSYGITKEMLSVFKIYQNLNID